VQEVSRGSAITPITYQWTDAGTQATVEGLADGLTYAVDGNSLTISGTPQASCTFLVTISGNESEGVKPVTTSGSITLVHPFRLVTGDWYPFRDAEDALPADLQQILTLVQGDKSATTIDPQKDEPSSGFGLGALCLGESDGGFTLTLSQGLLDLQANLYFTGGRQFLITYTLSDGTTQSVTTEKYKKGAYGSYDILAAAGLTDDAQRLSVRTITFRQNGANGGARIYDLLIKVPADDAEPTTIATPRSLGAEDATKTILRHGQLVIEKNGKRYNAVGVTSK
jgi:hypothetical protein